MKNCVISLVKGQNAPGRSLAKLSEVLTRQTADEHDMPLDELSTAMALRSVETVLAEEVVVHLPDGRAIHTLVIGGRTGV